MYRRDFSQESVTTLNQRLLRRFKDNQELHCLRNVVPIALEFGNLFA